MSRDHFWLTDRQFARIAPHLPADTRGKPRVESAGDQRHRSCAEVGRPLGRRAERLWPSQDALQSLCSLGRQGRLKDFRRVATRYDRLATNFLAAVCIAATVS